MLKAILALIADSLIMACMQSKEQLKALKAQRAAAEAKASEDAAKLKAKQVDSPPPCLPCIKALSPDILISIIFKLQRLWYIFNMSTFYLKGVPHRAGGVCNKMTPISPRH